jgi:peptide/nickel transport system substrate-binding protein
MLRLVLIALLVASFAAACAPSATPRAPGDAAPAPVSREGPKRIVAAITGDPNTLYNKLNVNNAVRGIDAVEKFVNVGVAIEGADGNLSPRHAEAVPSLENGLWTLNADGSMETTWRLRPGARWHDGTPVTADDLVFTAQVARDRELPVFSYIAFNSLDDVQAVDERTVRARWKQPYIDADKMFASGPGTYALPMPRHLLDGEYQGNKAGFIDLPYWSTRFVGNGPYRLKEWSSGTHLVLEAFDGYVLGRPKIDQVEVRFIPDSNTLVANVLAGEINLTLGRGISIDQAIQVREQWRGGKIETGTPRSALNLWPQLRDPSPAVIGDVRYRKALFYGIDRQSMVETLQGGLTTVVHSWIKTSEPEYAQLEPLIVKYEYDPRRATQMIESLGYAKGADGTFADAGGAKLGFEFRTIAADINQKTQLAIADNWTRLGLAVEPVVIPSLRLNDLPYRATFPAFDLLRGNTSIENFNNLHSSGARLPENGFRGGGAGGTNYTRYASPQLDALIDRFFATVPRMERMQIAGQIANYMTDQVLVMGMFYDLTPALQDHRLLNISPVGGDQILPWNAHEWDLR